MTTQIIKREVLCKSALNKTGIPGYDYCLNPYLGCAHGCVYCYASFMCRFSGHQEAWGEFLDVKVNFAEALARQLGSRRSKIQGSVILGTVTDAYQPAEAVYGITRDTLKVLAEDQRLGVHILTKSSLVTRDIDILKTLKSCEVGFTITTLNPKISEVFEPGASTPNQRLEAARRLMDAGIPVWIFIAPLLPGVSDTEVGLEAVLKALCESGVREILIDWLNPYPAVVHRLKKIYRQHFPEALPMLQACIGDSGDYRQGIEARIRRLNETLGCQAGFV